MNEVGIAIDMGGTTIKIGIVRDGDVLDHAIVVAGSHSSLKMKLVEIGDIIDSLLSKGKYTPLGIGLAFPGIVDARANKIISKYVKYPDAQQMNLSQWAAERWQLPIVLENDARAALLGEWRYGAGKGCDDLVLVTLGTGFGTAAMMNGTLLRGRNHIAGNLGGHITINLQGSICNCGNIGCLETECSAWAIDHYVRNLEGFNQSTIKEAKEISFRNIFHASATGDAFAIKVLKHCLNVWSIGVISLVHAYDPEKVIVGGGIMKSKEVIIPHISEMIKKHSWIKDGSVDVVSAEQIDFAGILGMYHLISSLKTKLKSTHESGYNNQ
ncbi:ROK family protein [Chryseolinea soli]|uniref:ROK family protein n=1 Tax=Chryseolinea soli TaxID=2321403 RepID=A0A385SXQ3_9BACT|nr:ROK family protein [Chryseolinea soli]AYB34857.1 ROK family protein [Chryseolinea soli]